MTIKECIKDKCSKVAGNHMYYDTRLCELHGYDDEQHNGSSSGILQETCGSINPREIADIELLKENVSKFKRLPIYEIYDHYTRFSQHYQSVAWLDLSLFDKGIYPEIEAWVGNEQR